MAQYDQEEQWQILQLAHRYALAVDSRDAALLAECFAPEIEVIGPGFALTEQVAEAIIAGLKVRYVWTQHNLSNPLYRVSGAEASGVINCVAHHIEEHQGSYRMRSWHIRYHDRLRQLEGMWRLCQRRLEVGYESVLPAAAIPQ